MGHLDSQRSLPVVRPDKLGFSPMAKKLRLASEHRAVIVNAPAGYLAQLTPGPADMTTDLQPNQTYDAVVLFVKDNGRIGFPFLLRRAALAVVERQMTTRQFSLHQLARSLHAQTVTLPRCQTHELFNINTPKDWKIARKQWHSMRDR